MYWDNYEIFLTGSFDGIPMHGTLVPTYTFFIYKKNYNGISRNCFKGNNPIVHTYLNDDPIAAIKGSEIKLNLINFDGTLPLSMFYSNSDDDFKIRIEVQYDTDTQTIIKDIFQGYLVQEDCSENITDIAHNIELTFTDNLGLLKGIDFNFANNITPPTDTSARNVLIPIYVIPETTTAPGYFKVPLIGSPATGDTLTIQGSLFADGTYTITNVITDGVANLRLFVREILPNLPIGSPTNTVIYNTPKDLNDVITLGQCLRICLQATGLFLNVHYGGKLSVSTVAQDRIFENIYLRGTTFASDSNNWDSCYDVLEKIMKRLGCSIFQADGVWYIMRWQELRYYSNLIPGRRYDPYFNYLSDKTMTLIRNLGDGTDIQAGIHKTIIRPYRFDKETFKYEQPKDFLKNGNLSELGNFIRGYADGTNFVKEYEWNGWYWSNSVHADKTFLRVIYNSLGNEIERYAVGIHVNNFEKIKSFTIEVNAGDGFTFSGSWRNNVESRGSNPWYSIHLDNGTTPLSLNSNGIFDSSYNPLYTGDRTTFFFDWQSIEITCNNIPNDGVLTVYLPDGYQDNTFTESGFETQYRDFTIEYHPAISGIQEIIGQEHNSYQGYTIKNFGEKDIFIDVTTRNYNKGTLFLEGKYNLIQNKCGPWKDGRTDIEYNLGEITTKQELLWKKYLRNKIEAKAWPLIDENYNFLTMYNVINFLIMPNTYFIFGKLEINYRENMFNFSMYEMWKKNENDMVLIRPPISHLEPAGIAKDKSLQYAFKYLFK